MTAEPGSFGARTTDAGQRKVWWVSLLIFLALGGLWAVASPLFSYPDEPAHVIYAAGVVRGDVIGIPAGMQTEVHVPASYSAIENPSPCYAFKPDVSAACLPPVAANVPGQATVGTLAGRYPPLFYLYAGLPSLFSTGGLGIYLMRLMTVALCAALLASAVASACARSRGPWPLAGLLLALSPMTLYFTGAVNPQGPEIAAGICLWTAGLALLGQVDNQHSDSRMRRRLILRVVTAGAVLATVRPISPLWLLLIVVLIVVAYAQRATFWAIIRLRLVWFGIAVVALLGAGTVAWVQFRGFVQSEGKTDFARLPPVRAFQISLDRLGYWLKQMVGLFGWLDTDAPFLTYVVWTALLGVIIVLSLMYASRRELLVMAALMVVGPTISIAAELASYKEHGFGWQGRYVLPLLVGVPILAGHILRNFNGFHRRAARRLWIVFPGLVAIAQFVAFKETLSRYSRGIPFDLTKPVSPLTWAPPIGSTALIAGFAVVLLLAAVLMWRTLVTAGCLAPGTDASERDEEPLICRPLEATR